MSLRARCTSVTALANYDEYAFNDSIVASIFVTNSTLVQLGSVTPVV